MKRLFTIVCAFLFAAFLMVNCGGEDDSSSGNSDCDEAQKIWGDKTQYIGDECSAGTYGSCPTMYDNCVEGVCKYSSSANHDICTKTCTSSTTCGSGMYCKDGYCQPAAKCETFCDGTLCCSYYNDPNDPTKCVQGNCW